MSTFSPKKKIERILFITLSNVGDVVLTTPVLSSLHARFPDAEISVLAGERAIGLFERHPWIIQTFVYNKKAALTEKIKLMRELRAMRFDLAIDLRHSLIPILANVRYRNPLIRRASAGTEPMHAGEKHMSVLRDMAIPIHQGNAFSFFDESTVRSVKQKFQDVGLRFSEPFFVMAPGARSHVKRWPADRFRELAASLHALYRRPVILVGDESERAITQDVRRSAEDFIFDLAGQTSLREYAAVIGNASLVVTNDSAALHLADLMNRPVVGIFGPTDEKCYGPRNAHSAVVRADILCRPCEKTQSPHDHECMNSLTVKSVLEACTSLGIETHVAAV